MARRLINKRSTSDFYGEKPPLTNKIRLDKVSHFDSSLALLCGNDGAQEDARQTNFNSSAFTTEDASFSRIGPYNSMTNS